MRPQRDLLDPETVSKLRGLRLRARHIVEGHVSGHHRSGARGFSIEFAEHRPYAPGDDLRYVDWKVFGRTDKYYLKSFHDETDLACYLLLDTSRSMQFRGPAAALSKFQYAQTLAAAWGCLILGQRDRVGLVTYDDRVRIFLPASSKPAQLDLLIEKLEACPPRGRSDTGKVLHEVAERITRRSLLVVLGDLLGDVASFMTGIQHLRHGRHEVVVFHILDPAEQTFPYDAPTLFQGLEDGAELLADPRLVRAAYLQELEAYQKQLAMGCRAAQVDYTPISTGQSFAQALAVYLAERRGC